MTKRTKLPLILLTCAVSSCASMTESYLEADKATYRVIAPDYTAYVMGDMKLNNEAKARRMRTLASWKARLDAASTSASPPAR